MIDGEEAFLTPVESEEVEEEGAAVYDNTAPALAEAEALLGETVASVDPALHIIERRDLAQSNYFVLPPDSLRSRDALVAALRAATTARFSLVELECEVQEADWPHPTLAPTLAIKRQAFPLAGRPSPWARFWEATRAGAALLAISYLASILLRLGA